MLLRNDIHWLHIYWVLGDLPRNAQVRFKQAIKDPPSSGWQHALVIMGEKRSTIFCPYSFDAWTVPTNCLEIATAKEPRDPMSIDRMAKMLRKNWDENQRRGWLKAYDTAALIFKRFGEDVPVQILRGGEEDTRPKGGKEVGSALLKPVKRSGKRGKFLEWFLDGDGVRPIREAMIEFDMTRSNALSYLYMLKKDHGIGYELVGDQAHIQLPEGCESPFDG